MRVLKFSSGELSDKIRDGCLKYIARALSMKVCNQFFQDARFLKYDLDEIKQLRASEASGVLGAGDDDGLLWRLRDRDS